MAVTIWLGRTFHRHATLVLVVAGLVVSAFFQALVSLIKIAADPLNQLPSITFWLLGGLHRMSTATRPSALIPIALAGFVLHALRWKVNTLAAGEDEARTMGVDVPRTRFLLILSATLMTAACVSISGIIGWVGLLMAHRPHAGGPGFAAVLPMSAWIGGGFLLGIDNLARAPGTTEIPLGILTALIGAPVLRARPRAHAPSMVLSAGHLRFAEPLSCCCSTRSRSISRPAAFSACSAPTAPARRPCSAASRLERLSSGRVALDGRDLLTLGPAEAARLMAYVPQDHRVGLRLPCLRRNSPPRGAHAASPLHGEPEPDDRRIAREAMARLHIAISQSGRSSSSAAASARWSWSPARWLKAARCWSWTSPAPASTSEPGAHHPRDPLARRQGRLRRALHHAPARPRLCRRRRGGTPAGGWTPGGSGGAGGSSLTSAALGRLYGTPIEVIRVAEVLPAGGQYLCVPVHRD